MVAAGEPVLVLGAGRTFADLAALLTVGRGGRFAEGRHGETIYVPSGAEPLLYVGSRRGVPSHARPGHPLTTPPSDPPRFPEEDLRAAVAKRLAYAYYHELFTRHPERTRTTWRAFEAAFARAGWGGKELRALVTKSVPRFADRLLLDRLANPLHGMRFGDLAGLQRWMHGYLAADLERGSDPAFSADLAMLHAPRGARPAPPRPARRRRASSSRPAGPRPACAAAPTRCSPGCSPGTSAGTCRASWTYTSRTAAWSPGPAPRTRAGSRSAPGPPAAPPGSAYGNLDLLTRISMTGRIKLVHACHEQ
ncbi:hypothetical protein AB0I15_25730, partial [Nonomuraea sp. NPDC050643]